MEHIFLLSMFGEKLPKKERSFERRPLLLALAGMIALGMPEISHAETPESESLGFVEPVGDASLSTHVNGEEPTKSRAKECKAAYDSAMSLRKEVKGKKAVWLVVDTAIGGSQVQDHLTLARSGVESLKACFAKQKEKPKVVHLVNNEANEIGVAMYPVEGTILSHVLSQAEVAEGDAIKVLSQSLTLDLTQNNPTIKDVRALAGGMKPLEMWGKVDSVTFGYSAKHAALGQHVFEWNGQIGMTTGSETEIVTRASGGIETNLSPVDGGKTTIGFMAELTRGNGKLDTGAGSYLVTNLGEGRPDLVLSAVANPNNGHIELGTEMALRFSTKIFEKGDA